jgi:hypothetical protein
LYPRAVYRPYPVYRAYPVYAAYPAYPVYAPFDYVPHYPASVYIGGPRFSFGISGF